MTDGWSAQAVAVCVPVRNEARLLPALLASLARQELPDGVRATVCFLFDGCVDASAAIVARAAPTLSCAIVTDTRDAGVEPNAGQARGAALALGQRVLGDGPGGALLTTDADSVPARDWIATTCRALLVSDVVAGRIVRRDPTPHPAQDRLEAYYDRLAALRRSIDPVSWEPAPAHHHTGGASLAFRAGAYAALGGFAPIACGEDAAIVDEAHRRGLRVRRDRDVVVETSARRIGRAAGGLADHLCALDRGGAQGTPLVAHPADAAWQYRGHAAARAAWPTLAQPGAAARLAEGLAVDPDHVRRVAAEAANAEAFAIRVVPAGPNAHALVPLAEAERALALAEQTPHERAA